MLDVYRLERESSVGRASERVGSVGRDWNAKAQLLERLNAIDH